MKTKSICALILWLPFVATLLSIQALADERKLQAGGLERTYRVYRPAKVAASSGIPLVVVLHGGFGTGQDAERRYGWDEAADQYGFMVAYPNGYRRTWNAGGCCGPAQKENIDDVSFLNQVIRGLISEGADPKRIFVAGMSNGGAMTYRYACDGAVPIAAIGIISGALTTPCPHPQKLSLLAVHGTTDQHIPINGGVGKKSRVAYAWPAFEDTLSLFRNALNCSNPVGHRDGALSSKTANCAQGNTVTQITIEGAGHQWPGSKANDGFIARMLIPDPPSKALNATQTLSEFFLAHPGH